MAQEQEQLLASVFCLAGVRFGVPAAEIQEVVQVGNLTPVHHAPAYVAGIRNLRGHIVTVIDLAVKLGLGSIKIDAESRILIINCCDELIGVMVESIEDTVFLDRSLGSETTPMAKALDPSVVRGMYDLGGGLLTLLDQNKILQSAAHNQTSVGLES